MYKKRTLGPPVPLRIRISQIQKHIAKTTIRDKFMNASNVKVGQEIRDELR